MCSVFKNGSRIWLCFTNLQILLQTWKGFASQVLLKTLPGHLRLYQSQEGEYRD